MEDAECSCVLGTIQMCPYRCCMELKVRKVRYSIEYLTNKGILHPKVIQTSSIA